MSNLKLKKKVEDPFKFKLQTSTSNYYSNLPICQTHLKRQKATLASDGCTDGRTASLTLSLIELLVTANKDIMMTLIDVNNYITWMSGNETTTQLCEDH